MLTPIPIRASSLPDLFDCPARWEAKHLLKIRMPTSSAARLGTAVHAGTALYDQSRLDGNPLTMDEAAGAVVDVIYGKDDEVEWEEISQTDAEKIAIPLHNLYCQRIAPAQNYVAVETTCESLTFEDIGLTLTGTVDRIRKTKNGLGIADIKTGRTAVAADGTVKTQSHVAQVGAYMLLAGSVTGQDITEPAQIIGLQAAKTNNGRRVGIGEIPNALDALLDDGDKPGLLRIASQMMHSGTFYGNPRSQTCGMKYCPIYSKCRWRK